MGKPGLSFIVPAYNEENLLRNTIDRLRRALSKIKMSYEIIVVDDGSSDGTLGVAESISSINIVTHVARRGYGNALKSGLKRAKFDIAGIVDADGTYNIESLPKLILSMRAGADMAVGARENMYAGDGPIKKIFRWIFVSMIKTFIARDIIDPNSGFRLFKRNAALKFERLLCGTFSFTTSLTMAAKGSRMRVEYVPVTYSSRRDKSKIHYLRDSVNALFYIIRGMIAFFPLRIFLPLFCIIGVAITLISTSLYGTALFPDSIAYISTARNILSGNGYMIYTGLPYVAWPPLLPTLLALLGFMRIEPLSGIRLLNALVFGLTILASGYLFKMHIKSKVLVVLASAAVLLSFPVFYVSVTGRAESLFVLLLTMFVICLQKFLKEKSFSSLMWCSGFAALACLQRYIGVTLILSGILILSVLPKKSSTIKRLKTLSLFCAISTIPVGLWFVRNYTLTSTFSGGHIASLNSLKYNLACTLDTVTSWFLPSSIALPIRGMIFGFAVAVLALIASRFYRLNKNIKPNATEMAPALVLTSVYMLFLLTYSTILKLDDISDRLLAPIYVLVILFMFVGLDRALGWLRRYGNRATIIISSLCIVWLIYPLVRIEKHLCFYTRNGTGGYSTARWRQSDLIRWLKINPLEGDLYSNEPEALYIVTGEDARISPSRREDKREDFSEFKKYVNPEATNYLIWFDGVDKTYLYTPDELKRITRIRKTERLPDGTVYIFK
ncbi:glycosyltransferase [Candidatus Omnitrophota bacterium]